MGDQDNLILAPVPFDETQLTHPANHSVPKPGDPCHPLAAGARPPAIAFQERGRAGGRNLETQEDVAYGLTAPVGGGRRNEINVAFAFQTRIARNDRGQPEDVCPTLNGADAGETSDSRPVVAYEAKSFTVSENSNGFAWEGDVSPAVQAHQPNPEANTFSGVTDGWAVRRLTPRECERLQGFPDDWTLIPYGSKSEIDDDRLAYLQAIYADITREEAERLAADAPRYKAIGNSMAVNVMRWIGTRIQLVDDLVGPATSEGNDK
jgi:DNA (cytosine-5)-methyltransferase 1